MTFCCYKEMTFCLPSMMHRAREKDHLETQSAIASDDALEALLGENTMARSGGRRHRR